MSYVFNMVGGGSGGDLSPNDAVIHVNAPVGSTITFAKGGVTVKVLDASKSHVSATDSTVAEWYYSVSSSNYGTWTVTASLSGDSDSKTVTVSSNTQYDVVLSYSFVYVSSGAFNSALQMTRIENGTVYPNAIPVYYQTASTGVYAGNAGFYITAVDLTPYSALSFEYKMTYSSSDTWLIFGFSQNTTWANNDTSGFPAYCKTTWSAATQTQLIDVSNITGSYYFKLCFWNPGNTKVEINNMILTR